MAKKRRGKNLVQYVIGNLGLLLGFVLIWRGVWHLLDEFDMRFMGGDQIVTAVVGIVVGLLVLYLPDRKPTDSAH
ncbi:hypothetical protein COU20_01455 [Candidatus Kaiserbacteria bacterium CG10_big_fil_rev_8_21_14_0_10_59_10]|uniref:Uncharacterized protein n=1 Tax=Candidatus Kaiserbacteria bacterium CG10_big_fil_rev_8_21_14_0_10_59_10 TaxID=1974612 RepID=A0A2H0U8C6_9BACT|nr:MAG: hypothetical protein COU20_01455 [Candidatus Kaiserbacteria bacterium CG10_big_fil_rev_8_21_14_0_10_59_10]